MSPTATADPVRAQVEEALRQLVETVAAAPCRVVRRARDSATTTIGVARTVAELALGRVFGTNGTSVTGGGGSAPRPTPPAGERSSNGILTTAFEGQGPSDSSGAADALPLEGYESLAASQVVARLARLSPAELEQIKDFEHANRGRRTILGKIEQLQTP